MIVVSEQTKYAGFLYGQSHFPEIPVEDHIVTLVLGPMFETEIYDWYIIGCCG